MCRLLTAFCVLLVVVKSVSANPPLAAVSAIECEAERLYLLADLDGNGIITAAEQQRTTPLAQASIRNLTANGTIGGVVPLPATPEPVPVNRLAISHDEFVGYFCCRASQADAAVRASRTAAPINPQSSVARRSRSDYYQVVPDYNYYYYYSYRHENRGFAGAVPGYGNAGHVNHGGEEKHYSGQHEHGVHHGK